MLIDNFKEDTIRYAGDAATLASFQAAVNGEIPKPYIDWMDSLPYYIELDNYILVHAGLNFETKFPLEDEVEMIWIRDWYTEIDQSWLEHRIIVHGHTPVPLLDIKKSSKRLAEIPAISIDAGCVFHSIGFGRLVAFNLDTKEVIYEHNIDIVKKEKPTERILPNEDHPLSLTIKKPATTKVLYFDIDGTFLDYDDLPKLALLNGQLEAILKKSAFDYIACMSGWSDIFSDPVMKLDTIEKRKEALYQMLEPLFPDKEWFLEKVILITDTDHRCKYIDLNIDWYYVDDWADEFMAKAHGAEVFEREKGNRILLCDQRGDGKDVLAWLEREIKISE